MQYIMILITHVVSHRSEGDSQNFPSVVSSEHCCKHSSCKIYYFHYRFILPIKIMCIASTVAAVLPAINHREP